MLALHGRARPHHADGRLSAAPSGGGHAAHLAAFEAVVDPARRRFGPGAIVVASGLDANGFDPFGRMIPHSDTFRALTGEICGGRLV